MSVCPSRVDFKEFLGDGSDENLLRIQIPDKATYEQVLRDLEYWTEGSNSTKNAGRHPGYYFPTGILVHENVHFAKNYDALKETFDNAFAFVRQISTITAEQYHCPSEAVEGAKNLITPAFTMAFSAAQAIRNQVDDKLEDHIADKTASQFYIDMKSKVETWASTQLWFK